MIIGGTSFIPKLHTLNLQILFSVHSKLLILRRLRKSKKRSTKLIIKLKINHTEIVIQLKKFTHFKIPTVPVG